jgi:YD repeat-containing protein
VLQKRMIEHVRTLYRRNDLASPLPLGQLQSLAFPFEGYKCAFTPSLVTQVYGARVMGAMLESEARYVHSEGDANWWIPSGQIFYSPSGTDSAAQELAFARQHFFLPRRFRDPFGQTATVTYDAYDFLVDETSDALGNRVTVGERNAEGAVTVRGNDYRVLQPRSVMDPNRNRSLAAFDALGMVVVGMAMMGKPEERVGDSLDGFIADLPDAAIAAYLQDPLADPHAILQRATTRFVYDLFAFSRSQGDSQPRPAVAAALARATHDADLGAGQKTRIQHALSYSGSTRNLPSHSATGASSTAPRATTTARLRITPRRSGSIRNTPWPSTTAASRTAPRATTTAPSPITPKPSDSIRIILWLASPNRMIHRSA